MEASRMIKSVRYFTYIGQTKGISVFFKFLGKNHEYVSETACTINISPITKK